MIASFADTGTEDIYHLRVSKVALKTLPAELHRIAKRKLNIIALATHLKDLKSPPGSCLAIFQFASMTNGESFFGGRKTQLTAFKSVTTTHKFKRGHT